MRACCPICTDVFDEVQSAVACPCGHVFHEDCLSKWMNQSSTCPECRKKTTNRTIVKLFFNVVDSEAPNLNYLENEMDSLRAGLKVRDVDIAKLKKEKAELQAYARAAEEKADERHVEILRIKTDVTNLQLMVKNLNKLRSKIDELERTNATLQSKVQHFHNVQSVISGTQKDLDDMLQTVTEGPEALKQMATYCSLLKRELSSLSDSKQKLRNEITTLRKNITLLNVSKKQSDTEIIQLKEQVSTLEKENVGLMKRRRVENSPTCVSRTDKVNVSARFESPAPERLKLPLSDNDFSVTPVRDRIAIQPLTKVNVINKGSMPHERTFNLSKPTVGQSSLLHSISNMEHKLHDANSVIRNGYNGLGGHSKFISRSLSLKDFKPPHKRKQ